jgi:Domain of unknown function (DUF1932)
VQPIGILGLGEAGGAIAAVALMAPVPGRGLRTPAIVSGPGAEVVVATLGPLGMPVTRLGGPLSSADEATLRRMEDGSRRHAARRAHEMSDAAGLLRELGVTPHVSEASSEQLRELHRRG